MKKTLSLVFVACATLLSARGALVYTTFDIPSGSPNTGTFLANNSLDNTGSFTGPSIHTYAYRFFTPSVGGTYYIGITDATYDPVMMIYSGKTSFPTVTPSSGLIAFNDDGAGAYATEADPAKQWSWNGAQYYFGTQVVNSSADGGNPQRMPLVSDISLNAGTNYLVAISQYWTDSTPIPLPASFFVAGPAAVALDGAAAVPEPGQVAASVLLLAGIGGYVFLKRRKAAQPAAPAAA